MAPPVLPLDPGLEFVLVQAFGDNPRQNRGRDWIISTAL